MSAGHILQLIERGKQQERDAILTILRVLQDDMTVRAIAAPADVRELVAMVVRDGVGSCIKLIEERSKP